MLKESLLSIDQYKPYMHTTVANTGMTCSKEKKKKNTGMTLTTTKICSGIYSDTKKMISGIENPFLFSWFF